MQYDKNKEHFEDVYKRQAKGKHLTGTVEEPEHSDIFVKEFIVSEEDVREKNAHLKKAVRLNRFSGTAFCYLLRKRVTSESDTELQHRHIKNLDIMV